MVNKTNILLTIIIICLVSYIIYDKYNDRKDSSYPVNGTVIDNRNNTDNVKYYSYHKDIESENDNELVYKSVYLFEDNTYYYSFSDKGDNCNNWSKGEYKKENNSIILNEKSYGGCDKCYYTTNLKTYTFRVVNDTLVSNSNEMLTLSKVDILPIINIEELDGIKNCSK